MTSSFMINKHVPIYFVLVWFSGDILDWANNRPFSTYDHVNDEDDDNCTSTGGWWFNHCSSGIPGVQNNLNGEYFSQDENNNGIKGSSWNGTRIMKSEMKLRRTSSGN